MEDAKREMAKRQALATLGRADKSRLVFVLLSLAQWPLAWWYVWGFWHCVLGYAIIILLFITLGDVVIWGSLVLALGGLVWGLNDIGAAQRRAHGM